jgi:hypothetical protein
MAAQDPMQLFRLLLAGETQPARHYFRAVPRVADPILGVAETEQAWEDFARAKSAWLREHRARLQPMSLTATRQRVVSEATLYLRLQGRTVPLPLAIAADIADGRWAAVRIYHSMEPLTGCHLLRPPLLPADPALTVPGIAGRYHAALRTGDLEGVIAAFSPTWYAREPNGKEQTHQGTGSLRGFFAEALADRAGIGLEYCTVVDDGVRVALEYNCVRWGKSPVPPQAGIAVYERGPNGLLAAARFYDDIEPPVASARTA